MIAFDGGLAAGWRQLTTREALPGLDRVWRVRRVDELPVWSLTCFYVRQGYRRKGITAAPIGAAVKIARAAGAPALEACPLDGGISPSASSTGYASSFLRAGFKILARRSPERPIMRRTFRSAGAR